MSHRTERLAAHCSLRASYALSVLVFVLAGAVPAIGRGVSDAARTIDRAVVDAVLQGNPPADIDPGFCQAVRHFGQLGGRLLFAPSGTLTGVDLAVERMSVSDDDLQHLRMMPALETLKLAGGTITNQSLPAIVRHRTLRTLTLNGVQIDGTGLAKLAELPNLQALRIRQASALADADLACLERFRSLRYLELIEDGFSDRGMSAVARIAPLRLLDLRGNVEITHIGIRALTPLKSLVALRIGSPSIDDGALTAVTGLAGVRRLTLDHAAATDAGLAQLGKLALEELILTSCFQIGDKGLQTVCQFNTLTTLSCRDMFFSATGLAAIGRLERLRTLQLNDLLGLDDICLDALMCGGGPRRNEESSSKNRERAAEPNGPQPARLAKLTRLELRGAEITAAGLARVATLGSLQHLNLANCQVDDGGVVHLIALQNLRTLDLSDNLDITDAAVDLLGRMPSLRQLNVDGTAITASAVQQLRARRALRP